MTELNSALKYDAAVVGSGIAGLLVAIELSSGGMRVALICKGSLSDSNTAWAQGGIAVCTGENHLDSKQKHLQDTLAAGAGLVDERIARLIIEGGTALFKKLEKMGLHFDRENGKLSLAREGGHSQARVLHSKDASGKALTQVLGASARRQERLDIFENCFAVDLLKIHDRCAGLRVLADENLIEIQAQRVVLASGGPGQIFERSTNPLIATGDGIAMAYRAGALLADMEFVQFHPTALCLPGAPPSLISEAVRGDGAHLIDSRGERFAFRFHCDGELATRDVVSRAILSVINAEGSNSVRLDMRPLGEKRILAGYPNILESCRRAGIDPLKNPVPVAPAAHYFMGGIVTDESGRSSLPGLYAVGECACTGLHGANRLASNSLLEGGVMALEAAAAILNESPQSFPKSSFSLETALIESNKYCLPQTLHQLKRQMFRQAGLIREESGLLELLNKELAGPFYQSDLSRSAIEAANTGVLAKLLCISALRRRESRGAHYRSDFPYQNDTEYRQRFIIGINSGAEPECRPEHSPALQRKQKIKQFAGQAAGKAGSSRLNTA